MDFLTFILLCVCIFFASFFASMLGLGGGVFYVPILVLIFDFSIKEAIPMSLAMVFATGSGAAINYLKNQKVLVRLGLFLETSAIFGAVFGVYFSIHTGENLLILMFAGVLILSAMKTLSKGQRMEVETEPNPRFSLRKMPRRKLALSLLASFAAGFLSASLGIGGGIVKVPILNQLMGIPMRNSVATSSFMIMITTLFSTAVYGSLGKVDFYLAIPLAGIALLGALSGSKFALERVKVEQIRTMFTAILLFVAARLILAAVL